MNLSAVLRTFAESLRPTMRHLAALVDEYALAAAALEAENRRLTRALDEIVADAREDAVLYERAVLDGKLVGMRR